MKPFDLSAAINGAKLVTRDEREVTEFHYFKTRSVYKVAAIIDGDLCLFLDNGMTNNRQENLLDLFLKSEKKKLWIPIPVKELNSLTGNRLISHTRRMTIYLDESRIDKEYKNDEWQIVEVEILV